MDPILKLLLEAFDGRRYIGLGIAALDDAGHRLVEARLLILTGLLGDDVGDLCERPAAEVFAIERVLLIVQDIFIKDVANPLMLWLDVLLEYIFAHVVDDRGRLVASRRVGRELRVIILEGDAAVFERRLVVDAARLLVVLRRRLKQQRPVHLPAVATWRQRIVEQVDRVVLGLPPEVAAFGARADALVLLHDHVGQR